MRMISIVTAWFFLLAPSSGLLGQFWEEKSYTRWTEKEARRFMEESPWCYDFKWVTSNNIGESVRYGTDSEREITTIFRLTLFSAHVVRQAYVALAAKGDIRKFNKYRDFIEREYDEIVVALTLDSIPAGSSTLLDIHSQLEKLGTPELVSQTYLATDSGKKIYLKKYIPPTPDGTGAKFVFPRTMPDGTPFLTITDRQIKFQTIEFEVRTPAQGPRWAAILDGDHSVRQRSILLRRAAFEEPEAPPSYRVAPEARFRLDQLSFRGRLDY
ncbi:MAG: hypothetical protein JXQ27_16775 [Acidobacteria bacterium]|nr:hypothetical protein [Acidobacteriota bacterium]